MTHIHQTADISRIRSAMQQTWLLPIVTSPCRESRIGSTSSSEQNCRTCAVDPLHARRVKAPDGEMNSDAVQPVGGTYGTRPRRLPTALATELPIWPIVTSSRKRRLSNCLIVISQADRFSQDITCCPRLGQQSGSRLDELGTNAIREARGRDWEK
jgi:hypothetical protein